MRPVRYPAAFIRTGRVCWWNFWRRDGFFGIPVWEAFPPCRADEGVRQGGGLGFLLQVEVRIELGEDVVVVLVAVERLLEVDLELRIGGLLGNHPIIADRALIG